MTDLNKRLTDKPSILANLDKITKDAWDAGEIPEGHTWAIINTFDNEGNKLQAAVRIVKKENLEVKAKAIWEHDWDGNDTIAGKVVVSGK